MPRLYAGFFVTLGNRLVEKMATQDLPSKSMAVLFDGMNMGSRRPPIFVGPLDIRGKTTDNLFSPLCFYMASDPVHAKQNRTAQYSSTLMA